MTPAAMMLATLPLPDLDHIYIYIGLLAGMVLALAVGHWLGRRHQISGNVSVKDWVGIVDGPILAIFGLLLAFSFYGAMQRFDERRKLIIEESVALASAYRYTDLLSSGDRPAIQNLLRDYVAAQAELRNRAVEAGHSASLYGQSRQAFEKLWDATIAATSDPNSGDARGAMLSALGDIDRISTISSTSPYLHPPFIIFVVLLLLSLVSAFLLGYQASTFARKSWVHLGLFVIFLAVVSYLIVALEYPRVGAIRIGDMQDFIRERHRAMEY
jgi:hypothetical protein